MNYFIGFLMFFSAASTFAADPSYEIPANAKVADYTCVDTTTERENGGEWKEREFKYSGVESSWAEGESEIYVDRGSEGNSLSWIKVSKQVLADGKILKTNEVIDHTNFEGVWEQEKYRSQTLLEKVDGVLNIVSTTRNGVPLLIRWGNWQETKIDEKKTIMTRVAKEPRLFNRPQDSYEVSRRSTTCLYVTR